MAYVPKNRRFLFTPTAKSPGGGQKSLPCRVLHLTIVIGTRTTGAAVVVATNQSSAVSAAVRPMRRYLLCVDGEFLLGCPIFCSDGSLDSFLGRRSGGWVIVILLP